MTSAAATLRDALRDRYIPENFSDPLLDPIRSGPQYQRILQGLGLSS